MPRLSSTLHTGQVDSPLGETLEGSDRAFCSLSSAEEVTLDGCGGSDFCAGVLVSFTIFGETGGVALSETWATVDVLRGVGGVVLGSS